MIIKTMWGLRHGASSPELMEAWDTLYVDKNPKGFTDACEKRRKEWGSDLKTVRFLDLAFSTRAVHEAFAPQTIMARVADVNNPDEIEEKK